MYILPSTLPSGLLASVLVESDGGLPDNVLNCITLNLVEVLEGAACTCVFILDTPLLRTPGPLAITRTTTLANSDITVAGTKLYCVNYNLGSKVIMLF